MSNLILNATQFGVEESKAKQIEAVFQPMIKMLYQMENEYNNLIKETEECGVNEKITNNAKSLRIRISKVRIETDKKRKAEKEFYLRGGKAVDGIANILKNAVFEKENNLKEIENYFENIENERISKLQKARESELLKYDVENVETLKL